MSTPNHPTPRTDAEAGNPHNLCLENSTNEYRGALADIVDEVVPAALARQLERELTELRQAVMAHRLITDTEYGLGYIPDEEKIYNADFLRMLRALRNSRTWP